MECDNGDAVDAVDFPDDFILVGGSPPALCSDLIDERVRAESNCVRLRLVQTWCTEVGARLRQALVTICADNLLFYPLAAGRAEITFSDLGSRPSVVHFVDEFDGSAYVWRDNFLTIGAEEFKAHRAGSLSFSSERVRETLKHALVAVKHA